MAGSVISLTKAREIAAEWHGGQMSALYSLASWTGLHADLTIIRAAREVEAELSHEGDIGFFATPNDVIRLGQLQRYLSAEVKRRGL